MYTWQRLTKEYYQLGESPFWHPQEQYLYWVDIVGKAICRSDLKSQTAERWELPSEPGCIAPVQGGGLVMALRSGIYWSTQWQGALRWLVTLPYDPVTVRANDGKCDARGRLWVGTVDAEKKQRAALYCVDCTDQTRLVTCHIKGANTANGLAWSPDQRTLYWADTPQHSVKKWDFALATATLYHQEPYLQWPNKPHAWKPLQTGYAGRPDGACVNDQGDYFVALYEGACVEQYHPNGTMVARHAVPAYCPTMPCIGGVAMNTLFVTTARSGRNETELMHYPDSGAVFYKTITPSGLPVYFFNAPRLGAGRGRIL
jgi:sugar lactone lactonase YvrE